METISKTEEDLLTYFRKASPQAQVAVGTLARRAALTSVQRIAEMATLQKKEAETTLARPEVAAVVKDIDPATGKITPTAAEAVGG